jgi:hypothetical protein
LNKNDLRISIVLYGGIETSPLKWWEWYLYTKGLNEKLGRNPHHVSLSGDSFPPGSMLTFSGAEKKLKKAVEAGEHFKYLSLYSMPEQSMKAGFDHITYMLRTCFSEPCRILITLLPEDYLKLNVDEVVDELKNFIQFSSGQIFEMSISEFPFGYVTKSKPASQYKTLKIIKEL